MDIYTFNAIDRAVDNVKRDLGIISKGKSYMPEDKKLKARKARKKKQNHKKK